MRNLADEYVNHGMAVTRLEARVIELEGKIRYLGEHMDQLIQEKMAAMMERFIQGLLEDKVSAFREKD